MASFNNTRNVGIDSDQINVGKGFTFTADVNASTKAEDKVDAIGPAVAGASTAAQVSVLNSTITVGEAAKLTATELGRVIGKAEATSGDATASARNNGPTGGYVDDSLDPLLPDISIGKAGEISALVDNGAQADAVAVGGRASALADTGKVTGFRNIGIAAGEGTSLTASVTGANTANADSVGLPSDPSSGNASANAGSGTSSFVGILDERGGSVISFGQGAAIDAGASGALASDAKTVTGTATADTRADQIAGISSSGLGLDISIGQTGSLLATGDTGLLGANAKAESVSGPVAADVQINRIGGIIASPGSPTDLSIGQDGTVQAAAVGSSTADAASVTADSGRASINHDSVVGIGIDQLSIGANGSLYSGAQSTQKATVTGVTAQFGLRGDVAWNDQVIGIDSTAIATGGNLNVKASGGDGEAYLTGVATSSAVTGSSDAHAGMGSQVAGLRGGSLTVGESISGGGVFKVIADSALNAKASATTGAVNATAGGYGLVEGTLPMVPIEIAAGVVGLQSQTIGIGKSGSIRSDAIGSVSSDASTTTGAARAHSLQTARGLEDTRITIGENGSVTAAADLSGGATSDSVTGNANAMVDLTAGGVDQNTRLISIGLDGNVSGLAKADGDATATAVTGDVEASSTIIARGIDLGPDSSILIGQMGDVSAVADGGTSTVTAANTNGPAMADGIYELHGILGLSGGVITAGPKGGDISGSAKGGNDLLASTTTGLADATTNAALRGIAYTDLTAGLLGANKLTASADGNYTTTSTTVTGPSNATGNVSVGGLIGNPMGTPNTAILSGDVSAIAKLSNTVLATAVTGAATAEAIGNAVGISGYNINILGSGTISAQVISNTSTSASTVTV
jgi:hypothetical protein